MTSRLDIVCSSEGPLCAQSGSEFEQALSFTRRASLFAHLLWRSTIFSTQSKKISRFLSYILRSRSTMPVLAWLCGHDPAPCGLSSALLVIWHIFCLSLWGMSAGHIFGVRLLSLLELLVLHAWISFLWCRCVCLGMSQRGARRWKRHRLRKISFVFNRYLTFVLKSRCSHEVEWRQPATSGPRMSYLTNMAIFALLTLAC